LDKDNSNLENTRRALDDFKRKKKEVSRMLSQIQVEVDSTFDSEAYSAFRNVEQRYYVIIKLLEKRKKKLETSN